MRLDVSSLYTFRIRQGRTREVYGVHTGTVLTPKEIKMDALVEMRAIELIESALNGKRGHALAQIRKMCAGKRLQMVATVALCAMNEDHGLRFRMAASVIVAEFAKGQS